MNREETIKQIQKINSNQRNNIYELAILNDKELIERLKELTKNKKKIKNIYVKFYDNKNN